MATKKKATPKPPKPETYWWFEGETCAHLGRLLYEYPDARLEVRIDAEKSMTLTVRPKPVGLTDIPVTVLNFSHVCPPIC